MALFHIANENKIELREGKGLSEREKRIINKLGRKKRRVQNKRLQSAVALGS